MVHDVTKRNSEREVVYAVHFLLFAESMTTHKWKTCFFHNVKGYFRLQQKKKKKKKKHALHQATDNIDNIENSENC